MVRSMSLEGMWALRADGFKSHGGTSDLTGGFRMHDNDIITIKLDKGVLRFYQNGLPVTEQRGPVTESTPVIELSDGAKVVCNFGAGSWMHKPVSGFEGVIKSRSLLG